MSFKDFLKKENLKKTIPKVKVVNLPNEQKVQVVNFPDKEIQKVEVVNPEPIPETLNVNVLNPIKEVEIKNDKLNVEVVNQENVKKELETIIDSINTSFLPKDFDYIEISYDGDNPTKIIYRKGGMFGKIVSQIELSYSDDKLISINKIL